MINYVFLCYFVLGSIFWAPSFTWSFRNVRIQTLRTRRESETSLGLFNFFGGPKKDAGPTTSPKTGKEIKLEKISNTQGRDWKAEEIRIAAAQKPKEILDKQTMSFNFGKANEFPNLYKGWIQKDGGQIASQMIAATKKAISSKTACIEVLFDPVPNLDEVSVGSDWNQKFRYEVAANLKVPDFATNRGGPSTLEWSTLYWANRLAAGLGLNKVLVVSISGEGTKGQYLPTLTKGVTLVTLSNLKAIDANYKPNAVIILSPCTETHYSTIRSLGERYGCPAIALNSPYSYRYDIGGGRPFELAYVMKRIPKGWIWRAFPGEFQAIIEGPNYEMVKAKTFSSQPSLPEISKVSMAASAEKYGAAGNDRIFQNRL